MKMAVAMSGGVDSACSALLMKEAGHSVVGLHMKLMPDQSESWPKAQLAAQALDIPIYLVDLTRQFRDEIIDYFISEYSSGKTPSPCPRCNRKIKMNLLLEHAAGLGAEKLVTGHYARIFGENSRLRLLKGLDRDKDQSYFLFMLTQAILSRLCFPLGELSKTQVREIVQKAGLPSYSEDDSQELCFIRNSSYTDFLVEHGVKSEPGPILDTSGRLLGTHRGLIFYTVGQRKGLGIYGPEPSYVIDIKPENNSVIVGKKKSTFAFGALIRNVSFVSGKIALLHAKYLVKIRSTSRETPCKIEEIVDDSILITFKFPQSSVAPGQAAVFYDGEEVIGGGWIEYSVK